MTDIDDMPYERPDWFPEPETKKEPEPTVTGDPTKPLLEFDFKVYAWAMQASECPVVFPSHVYDHMGYFKRGYHTVQIHMSDEENDMFYAWKNMHQADFKIIGERLL